MDPLSAVLISWLISKWCVGRGAGSAAWSQAKIEARDAAGVIRSDLRGRGQGWANDLLTKLANGRSGGPTTAVWWGWAAFKAANAIRNGWTRSPKEGEPQHDVRKESRPWRRIWDAGVAGARAGREHVEADRPAGEQPTVLLMGVCGRCGSVVAQASLQVHTEDDGSSLELCVDCRAAQPRTRATAEPVDRPEPPKPQEGTRPALPAAADGDDVPAAPAVPEGPMDPQPEPEGDRPVAPRTPGQILPRGRHTLALGSGTRQPAVRTSGESFTHGAWQRAVADIERQLDELPSFLEQMLQRLTAADGGRSQIQGVVTTHRELVQLVEQLRHMLAEVNRRELPLLAAVNAAGGPDEIAGLDYYREV